MNAAYFEARFRVSFLPEVWPEPLIILSAWATTGESWSLEENEAADRMLVETLAQQGLWHLRITGYSPRTGHAEPSWAFSMPLEEACDLGQRFSQDALYYLEADQLSVTHCDHRRALVPVGPFRQRVDGVA